MAELADAHGSGPCGATRGGSNPLASTIFSRSGLAVVWQSRMLGIMSFHRLLPVVLCMCAWPVAAQDAVAMLKKLDEGFTAVFEKVAPAVVVIEATKAVPADEARPFDLFDRDDEQFDGKRERDWSRPQEPVQSEGSGFIIRADGYVLTNRHVVIGSEKVEVRGFSGQRWDASLVAEDERTDIAVLKLDAEHLPVIQWGDSDALRVGQLVCAIGAPYNQDYSFTCGWVSGKGRNNLLGQSSSKPLFEDYIQTDAFINPGNSGGPLFDVEGRVIGMNTLVNGLGRGLAFAIPSSLLRDVSEQLIETGRVQRPWLGVRITSLQSSRTLREQFPGIENGVVINTIEAGTPAAESELQPGDLLTAVDAKPLRDAHDLIRYVQRKKIGATLKFTLFRKGEKRTVSLVTAEQPEAPKRAAEHSTRTAPALGLELSKAESGVLIAEVTPGSAAARADLRAGDVITEVGSEPVAEAEAAMKAIQKSFAENPKKGALIRFVRGGKKSWAIIERVAR